MFSIWKIKAAKKYEIVPVTSTFYIPELVQLYWNASLLSGKMLHYWWSREKEKGGTGWFRCTWKVVSIVLTILTLLLASTIVYLGGELMVSYPSLPGSIPAQRQSCP